MSNALQTLIDRYEADIEVWRNDACYVKDPVVRGKYTREANAMLGVVNDLKALKASEAFKDFGNALRIMHIVLD